MKITKDTLIADCLKINPKSGEILQAVVGQRDGIGVERVGLDDIGTRLQILSVNLGHGIRTGQHEHVVAPLQPHRPVGKTLAAVILLGESVLLHHRAETAVEQHDALR